MRAPRRRSHPRAPRAPRARPPSTHERCAHILPITARPRSPHIARTPRTRRAKRIDIATIASRPLSAIARTDAAETVDGNLNLRLGHHVHVGLDAQTPHSSVSAHPRRRRARSRVAPSSARSRTFAAARGAVALRKLPASAVRAVSSTVCDRDAQNSFRQSLASSRARASALDARGPRSSSPMASMIIRDRSSRVRHRAVADVATARRDVATSRSRRRRPIASSRASIAHLNGGGHGVRICDVRDAALPLVRRARRTRGTRAFTHVRTPRAISLCALRPGV